MEDIIKEKISADHLLYVSLKYTKTCDVMVNLLIRWRKMMEISIDAILKSAKKKRKISAVPTSPLGKIESIRKIFKKDKDMEKAMDSYEMFRKIEELRKERIGEFRKNVTLRMFRKIEELRKERIGEFRKNVTLRVFYRGEEININLEKLKEYAEMIEKFVDTTKKFLSSKK
jgi:hypothetical protein